MNFRSNLKPRDREEKGWEKLQSELQYLYRKTGLVFIQEAGPVLERVPAPDVIRVVGELIGGSAYGLPEKTRPPPRNAHMLNAIVLWDDSSWTIDPTAIREALTWGQNVPNRERPRKAWRWHHLGNSIGIVRGES